VTLQGKKKKGAALRKKKQVGTQVRAKRFPRRQSRCEPLKISREYVWRPTQHPARGACAGPSKLGNGYLRRLRGIKDSPAERARGEKKHKTQTKKTPKKKNEARRMVEIKKKKKSVSRFNHAKSRAATQSLMRGCVINETPARSQTSLRDAKEKKKIEANPPAWNSASDPRGGFKRAPSTPCSPWGKNSDEKTRTIRGPQRADARKRGVKIGV